MKESRNERVQSLASALRARPASAVEVLSEFCGQEALDELEVLFEMPPFDSLVEAVKKMDQARTWNKVRIALDGPRQNEKFNFLEFEVVQSLYESRKRLGLPTSYSRPAYGGRAYGGIVSIAEAANRALLGECESSPNTIANWISLLRKGKKPAAAGSYVPDFDNG